MAGLPLCQQKYSTENTKKNSIITLLTTIIAKKYKDDKTLIPTKQLKYSNHKNEHNTMYINKNNEIDDYNIDSLFNTIPDVSDYNIQNEFINKNLLSAEQQKINDKTIKKYITTCNPTSLPAAFERGQRLEVVGKIII